MLIYFSLALDPRDRIDRILRGTLRNNQRTRTEGRSVNQRTSTERGRSV